MESSGTASKDNAGRFVSVQRLPYRSPALIEYGSVSKLTDSATGTAGDGNFGGMQAGASSRPRRS
jgi:hypothetical protein